MPNNNDHSNPELNRTDGNHYTETANTKSHPPIPLPSPLSVRDEKPAVAAVSSEHVHSQSPDNRGSFTDNFVNVDKNADNEPFVINFSTTINKKLEDENEALKNKVRVFIFVF
jgi:hypothetical protein